MDSGGTADDPLIGTVVDDRYEILGVIGAGGMGVVYEAKHVHTRRPLALKCLHAAISARKDVLRRFEREARAQALAGDPHVVEVVDFGVLPNGAPYMVMERLAGRDLATTVEQDEPLSLQRVIDIAVQACETMDRMHAQGVIHRDLKPDNLFLVDHPAHPDFLKVLDFGIACVRRPEEVELTQLTAEGALMGTPAYMSPEQAEGRSVDARTDVYALGAIVYFALSGVPPFHAQTLPLLIVQLTSAARPDVCDRRPDVPRALSAELRKAMARDPEDRHASARELARALSPFGARASEPVPVAAGPRAGRAVAVAALAGLSLVAVAALGLELAPSGESALESLPSVLIVADPKPAPAPAPEPATIAPPPPAAQAEAVRSVRRRPGSAAGERRSSAAVPLRERAAAAARPIDREPDPTGGASAQPAPITPSPAARDAIQDPGSGREVSQAAPAAASGDRAALPTRRALLPPANDIKRTP